MESMLFLSSCITSNMHSNSWVEMVYPVEDELAVRFSVCYILIYMESQEPLLKECMDLVQSFLKDPELSDLYCLGFHYS